MSILNPVKSWRNQKKIRKLSGQIGTVISYTIIHVPPAGFEPQAPYAVALVNLGNKRMIGQVVGYGNKQLRIGQVVQAVIRRVKQPEREGIIPYGIKFTRVRKGET